LALLTGAANDWCSGYELLRDLVSQALTQDAGGLAWINRANGRPVEIIRYDDGAVTVEYDPKGTGQPYYRIGGQPVAAENIIHVRSGFSRCPWSLCRDAISAAKGMESYVRAFWANSARPGGVITTPKPVGEKGVATMLAGWKAAFAGSENSGRTALLYDGATFSPLTMTSVDSQLLELRNFQIAEIARAFGVPQHVIGKLDRATWGNYSQAAKEYLTATVLPWQRAVEAALNRALLTDEERGEYRFCFDLDDFSQGSLPERASAISTLITCRTITPNDGRDWLGLPRSTEPGADTLSNPAIEPAKPTPDNDNTNQEEDANASNLR
jgi:HK97 family phage portal protein